MTAPAAPASRPGDELPPHTPLRAYYADEQAHRAYLRRVFDDTAPDYERIERLMAFGSGPWYRRCALQRAGLSAGATVLDVGIGTGLVAREALRLIGAQGRVTGIDRSLHPAAAGDRRAAQRRLHRCAAPCRTRHLLRIHRYSRHLTHAS
jgi:demethylmenaquinone methyltransferase / 2-methoxy-6-polyprenyl-1,4-benzoquinol methylase